MRDTAEASAGADLSSVRLHDDEEAHASTADLGALAYTFGHDIWFGKDQLRPGTEQGDQLLAHELAHTIQQGQQPSAPGVSPKLDVSQTGDAVEREADAAVPALLTGAPVSLTRAGPSIARKEDPPEWNAAYGSDHGDKYKETINQKNDKGVATGPELKAASEYKSALGKQGTPSKFRLSRAELLEIVTYAQGKQAVDYLLRQGAKGSDPAANREHAEGQLDRYMQLCERAFDIMMIDTIEAQANYIAHAAGETIFATMTEGQDKTQPFASDPEAIKIDASKTPAKNEWYDAWEKQPDGSKVEGKRQKPIWSGPMRYGQQENSNRGTIDPTGALSGTGDREAFDKTFIGRGPLQVTHRHIYVQTIAFLETRVDQLRWKRAGSLGGVVHDDEDDKKIEELEEAIKAIKAEPRNAADPKYAFLFSAAYAQMGSLVKNSPGGFTTAGMAGGQKDNQEPKKKKAYEKAVEILKRHKTEDDAKTKANATK